MKGFIVTLAATLVLLACSKPNKFSDSNIVVIYDLSDKRNSDSLAQFLAHTDERYRAEACLAFGSVQDTLKSNLLGSILLEDVSENVRANAAFALGQTGGFASVNALIPAVSDKSSAVVAEVLEALGKSITKNDLTILKTYRATDSITEAGLARALYRLGLRGLADSAVINRAKEFLNQKYSESTRLAAAHFFNRASVSGNFFLNNLSLAAKSDSSVNVRMAATSGLRKVATEESWQAIKECLNDSDYRVRSNAVRALQSFPSASKEPLYNALQDANVNVAIAATEVLKQIAQPSDSDDIGRSLPLAKNWRVRANLMEILVQSDTSYRVKILDLYNRSDNEYEKAWLLSALSKTTNAFDFISQQMISSKVTVIKTNAAQALTSLNRSLTLSASWKEKFATAYRNAIGDGDPGVIGVVTDALADPKLDFKSIITDFSFLVDAKNKLSLPKDIEALQPLEEAIAYFEGRTKPDAPKNVFNHPIDWALAKSIKKDQQVLIRTTKGDVVIQLLIEEAPGSVTNFITLMKQNYFNTKFFHRVVPNFVIQTGCNRGDGYGSEDYSIRSEFSRRRYSTGSVGMASAGKDTEGTQWFITHSPTPHLNGRYTIFANTISGMDAVHQMEVGDKILEVKLLN